MTRYVILFLLALMIVACSNSTTQAPDLTATQVVGEETTFATLAMSSPYVKASAVTHSPTFTITPASTLTPVRIVTQKIVPSSTPTPGPTPTSEITTRIKDGMSMVYVPAGDFIMGNLLGVGSDEEAPQHMVILDGYWIDRTEVTNAQYHIFVNATGYRTPALCNSVDITYNDGDKSDHPVVCVNWDDAQAYCAWAGGRLPTEAEWEKAARGVDGRTYPWGGGFDGSQANYCDTNCELNYKDTATNDGYVRTAPVGSYPAGASPYGTLDMAGNVWEWVNDWYNFFYYAKSPQINPQGPNMGEYRVLRGGAWSGISTNMRSAFRAWLAPDMGDRAIGFRCIVPSIPVP
jgi:eukaryotic-like serine/threonine-protein kinase